MSDSKIIDGGHTPEIDKLATFLDALDEWGCEDNRDRAKEILEFQNGGYDLSAYTSEDGQDEEALRQMSEDYGAGAGGLTPEDCKRSIEMRGAEADFLSHVSQLKREREWE